MRDDEWRRLEDEALERLLVERWLYRGAMLAVMLIAAIAVTYLSLRGVPGLLEQVTAAFLLVVALAAGAATYVMRAQDLRIYGELRRRRRAEPTSPP